MKKVKTIFSVLFISVFISSAAYADSDDCCCWGKDSSDDHHEMSFKKGFSKKMSRIDDGFLIFPGAEVGFGSGALSAAVGLNVGYKYGLFAVGTSLKGQVVNIDRVNYQFVPYVINISGLSYTVIPETSNDQNNRKLKGWAVGMGMGGKLTFSQLIEEDPDNDTKEEFLMINLGVGF